MQACQREITFLTITMTETLFKFKIELLFEMFRLPLRLASSPFQCLSGLGCRACNHKVTGSNPSFDNVMSLSGP